MNPIPLPNARGLHDLLLQPTMRTEIPFAQAGFEPKAITAAEHDFLVQNWRPDLVCLKAPDQALRALDFP